MIEFLTQDYISFLSLIVLGAGIVLFIMVIRNLLSKKEVQSDEFSLESEQSIKRPQNQEIEVIQTYLRTISDDLSEIKQKIISLTETLKSLSEQLEKTNSSKSNINHGNISEQITQINIKLDTIQKVLSTL